MVTYNIPTALVEVYQKRQVNLVVRSQSAPELVVSLTALEPGRLAYVQLIGLDSDADTLRRWDSPTPIDLTLPSPESDYPKLYEYADLVSGRPVRVSLGMTPGFGKAAKLAASLDMAVRLAGTQFDPSMLDEILEVLDLYLHSPTVRQPVEFFHSLLRNSYCGQLATLWSIQEEDPAEFRYITDLGEEVMSSRILEPLRGAGPDTFIEEQVQALRVGDGECAGCEFLNVCCGYFKWPERDYRCEGVKHVFRVLQHEAAELKRDVATCRQVTSEDR